MFIPKFIYVPLIGPLNKSFLGKHHTALHLKFRNKYGQPRVCTTLVKVDFFPPPPPEKKKRKYSINPSNELKKKKVQVIVTPGR